MLARQRRQWRFDARPFVNGYYWHDRRIEHLERFHDNKRQFNARNGPQKYTPNFPQRFNNAERISRQHDYPDGSP